MNRLEDALRSALDSDLDDAHRELVGAARRGAARRRTRRTTGLAVATVAAVAVVAGVGGTVLVSGSEDADPAPASPPTVDGAATSPDPRTMTVTAADDVLFATARERDCRCAALWSLTDGRWTRLHDFPVRYVDQLAVTPDGEHGLAADGDRLWATADGGRTWDELPPPGRPSADEGLRVAANQEWLFVVDTAGGGLWRAAVGTTALEQVAVTDAGTLHTGAGSPPSDDALVLESGTESHPVRNPRVSRDGGDTWTTLPLPCDGAAPLAVSPDGAILTSCLDGDGATLRRSTDLATWGPPTRVDRFVGDAVPLTDDRILLPSARMVVSASGAVGPTRVDTGLSAHAHISAAARVGDRTYLATTEGVLVATGDLRSWEPAG